METIANNVSRERNGTGSPASALRVWVQLGLRLGFRRASCKEIQKQ